MSEDGPIIRGEINSPAHRRGTTSAKTLVFTCAQNNTKLHDKFWASLMTFVEARGAELHISRITYAKDALGSAGAKVGTEDSSDHDDVWYDERITPYISDQSMQITPDLVWCGELNILPTRANPLSSFKTYAKGSSGVIPHVKVAMDSLPGLPKYGARFLYTTGTVTQRNYIQKIAGQVAEFHHVFGALLVEVSDSGRHWWARQIIADADGVIHDRAARIDGDKISYSPVVAITHGDIHIEKGDEQVLDTVFGPGGVVDTLKPRNQFFEDITDFTARNHHNINDPHFLWSKAAARPVSEGYDQAMALLARADRPYSSMFVVVSNHDQAINTWLKNTSAFYDPVNAEFWLAMNLHVATITRMGVSKPRPFSKAMYDAYVRHVVKYGKQSPKYSIINEDESLRIDDVEFGMHGHLGPNGSRGSPKNLGLVGKATTGHTHSAGIIGGVYTAGVYGKLDMGYNKGPSSWSHSFVVQYKNGKRAVYTIRDGKAWRD